MDELAKKLSVANAVRWVCSASNDISRTRVKKHFWKSAIKSNTDEDNFEPEEENHVSSWLALITDEPNHRDYVNIIENVPTEAGFLTLDKITEAKVNAAEGGGGVEEDASAALVNFEQL